MELPMTAAAAYAQLKLKGMSCGYGDVTMEIRWAISMRRFKSSPPSSSSSTIPIYITTNPSHVKPKALRELYRTCNRFPKLDQTQTGRRILLAEEEEEGVDIKKLCIALAYSPVVVSVFCNPQDLPSDNQTKQEDPSDLSSSSVVGLGDLLRRVMPLPLPLVLPSNGLLVGFGSAVSDLGLTASIHDVMVMPSLRGMGIGKMIVKRIVRMLTNREVYDISALCSANERDLILTLMDQILEAQHVLFRASNLLLQMLVILVVLYPGRVGYCHVVSVCHNFPAPSPSKLPIGRMIYVPYFMK